MMKWNMLIGCGITALVMSGCFSYEHRRTEPTAVVVESPVVSETTVTTLPVGYRTRDHGGVRYYYTRDVYYRSAPGGGYVIVPRPW